MSCAVCGSGGIGAGARCPELGLRFCSLECHTALHDAGGSVPEARTIHSFWLWERGEGPIPAGV